MGNGDTMTNGIDPQPALLLRTLFATAVATADPARRLAMHLPEPPRGRCVVVGAGKASAQMAAALEAAWPAVEMEGAVVTRYGHGVPTRRIEVLEAAHPIPDARSEQAAQRMLDAVTGLNADDLVVALVSGGGSATLALPAPGLSFADKTAVHVALLHSGAPIGEMNLVRSALSAIKGGRLAVAAAPARVVTLVISDVPGDDPAQIASGPTVGSPAKRAEAREIIARRGISVPAAVTKFLDLPDDLPVPATGDVHLIATPGQALDAVVTLADRHGVACLDLGDAIEGEAREAARVMAGIVRSIRSRGRPVPAPLLIVSGGETSVTIGAGPAGRGGRNTEFLLALALALEGVGNVWALAGDTDGIDGSEDAAGAVIDPNTLVRARALGLDPAAMLAGHDSYSLFAALGDLVVTGPTHTNVNDFRAILVA